MRNISFVLTVILTSNYMAAAKVCPPPPLLQAIQYDHVQRNWKQMTPSLFVLNKWTSDVFGALGSLRILWPHFFFLKKKVQPFTLPCLVPSPVTPIASDIMVPREKMRSRQTVERERETAVSQFALYSHPRLIDNGENKTPFRCHATLTTKWLST